jgi:hypothetical protein
MSCAVRDGPPALTSAISREGIPAGRAGWIDATIRRQRERGTGILNNELYAGRLVWNRVSYVTHPCTGKRQARPHLPEGWERAELPSLRVSEEAL